MQPGALKNISSSREGALVDGAFVKIPILNCKNGPRKILKKDVIGGSQYIYYSFKAQGLLHHSSCTGLKCSELRCLSRYNRTHVETVIKIKVLSVPPYFQIVGFVPYKWVDHLRCDCQSCQDIKEYDNCQCEDRCPNVDAKAEKIRGSFCKWRELRPNILPAGFQYTPGRCECCRVPLSCPKGRFFSRESCSCKCVPYRYPPGHFFNYRSCQCERLVYTIRPIPTEPLKG